MSNSNKPAPRERIDADQRRLDAATFDDGAIVIRKNVGTNGDFKIVVNATLSATEAMKLKDGAVFNVRVTE